MAALPEALLAPPISTATQYHELPKYLRHLTTGDGAVFVMPREVANLAVAIDLGSGEAAVLFDKAAGSSQGSALHAALRTLRAKLRERAFAIQDISVTANVLAEVLRNPGKVVQAAGTGEPIAMFRRWIGVAIKQGGSDVHVEIGEHSATIRVRVDGSLVPLADGARGAYSRATALDAVAAGYNTTKLGNSESDYDHSRLCDCIIAHSDGDDCELRFQSMPGRDGPKIVMRIQRLSERTAQGTFASAGYTESQQRDWKRAARIGKGLVIITGSVNSGKSTSAQTFLEQMPDLPGQAVYTVEDPIERKIAGVHQMEVLRDLSNPKATEEKFAAVIRGLLRGDLDAVMLGEVRDWLSANFFLQVGQTGHLAMGTLHAHFLTSIVPRLTNTKMGLTREELCSPKVLNLLVYQSLLPRLCERCKMPARFGARKDKEIGEMLEVLASKFALQDRHFHVKGPGCAHCGGRGTKGRVVVAEMFQPDRRWLDLTRIGDDHAASMHYRSLSDRNLWSDNMIGKTVFEHALLRALHGEVDFRQCEEFEAFDRFELL